jgi:hypothetical protein
MKISDGFFDRCKNLSVAKDFVCAGGRGRHTFLVNVAKRPGVTGIDQAKIGKSGIHHRPCRHADIFDKLWFDQEYGWGC